MLPTVRISAPKHQTSQARIIGGFVSDLHNNGAIITNDLLSPILNCPPSGHFAKRKGREQAKWRPRES
jgi:hypothetical protein